MPSAGLPLVAAISALALALAGPARGGDPIAALEAEQTALYDRVAPSVVLVTRPSASGAGFFVRSDGLVLTAAHVVGAGEPVDVVLADGRRLRAERVALAPDGLDLALLRVAVENAPALELADASALRPGSFAATVGHGGGAGWTFATGLVANLHPLGDAPFLHAQLPLRPGSSGAPVVDRAGRAVAVVAAGPRDASGLVLAIRADAARAAFAELARPAPAPALAAVAPSPAAEPETAPLARAAPAAPRGPFPRAPPRGRAECLDRPALAARTGPARAARAAAAWPPPAPLAAAAVLGRGRSVRAAARAAAPRAPPAEAPAAPGGGELAGALALLAGGAALAALAFGVVLGADPRRLSGRRPAPGP